MYRQTGRRLDAAIIGVDNRFFEAWTFGRSGCSAITLERLPVPSMARFLR